MKPRYQLICEGSCNPHLPALDLNVLQASRISRFGGGIGTTGDEELWHLQRTLLRHTPHEATHGQDRYRCTACGATRRWGGNPRYMVTP